MGEFWRGTGDGDRRAGRAEQLVQGGTAGVTLAGSTVTGPVTVNSNSGGTVVAGNTMGGPLSCSGNNPPPTDDGQPNAVSGPAAGQCSTLA
jgi:hypothetical protein